MRDQSGGYVPVKNGDEWDWPGKVAIEAGKAM